ncbi:MAG: type II toxin-antitoxin system prevent-host-death family antitoxin [Xanthomonadaceae bacterium]|nr:type II toxin-antitoxin system prevent-host-death family antitoxin [Xanthomonadaceae bacterium]
MKISEGYFPGIEFSVAMHFILNDGLMSESALPVQSLLKLESWVIAELKKNILSYSATELKNKTGEILDQVLRGNTVRLLKHGRAIAEITPVS